MLHVSKVLNTQASFFFHYVHFSVFHICNVHELNYVYCQSLTVLTSTVPSPYTLNRYL